MPPAGLVGNWEREMRELFRLHFRIVGGMDARTSNPFSGKESDLAIVSLDTPWPGSVCLTISEMPRPKPMTLSCSTKPISCRRIVSQTFECARRTGTKLAEAIAGAEVDDKQWILPWSSHHLLLLTATPHMGRDYPYYFLWRLLLPDSLQTKEAFDRFPPESRRDHFVRRTKEEMVHFNGTPLYPQRNCDTLSYELTQGPGSEQELYDETSDYILGYYNRAQLLNRSAARLAMSVFQRASSQFNLRPHALIRTAQREARRHD